MLYTLFQRFNQFRTSSVGRSTDKKSYQLGSYRTGESNKAHKKNKKFQHPLSMPNDTAMDSDERIVVEPKADPEVGPIGTADGGYGHVSRHRDESNATGIRVQTVLSVESSKEYDENPQGKNNYHNFPDTRR